MFFIQLNLISYEGIDIKPSDPAVYSNFIAAYIMDSNVAAFYSISMYVCTNNYCMRVTKN